jgi:hypothetical protein
MSQVYQTDQAPSKWLLLIHRLPPKPDYLRVKVKRRLDRIGALAIKNSVYALPDRADTTEDFQWLAVEIEREGGDVLICRSELIAGTTDEEVISRFNAERETAYRSIGESVAAELRVATGEPGADSDSREKRQNFHARAQRQLDEVIRLDFFGADGRSAAEEEIRRFHSLLQMEQASPTSSSGEPEKNESRARLLDRPSAGSTWVTRAGVFVDRMASAWLIRKFVDPSASFKFVSVARYRAGPGEIRFDMVPAEYTHEGDMCTFEVLLERFDLHDAGTDAIAEVVHDIDLKDEKYGRSEAAGIEAVLAGIVRTVSDDDSRLAAAFPLFDALYDRFRSSSG